MKGEGRGKQYFFLKKGCILTFRSTSQNEYMQIQKTLAFAYPIYNPVVSGQSDSLVRLVDKFVESDYDGARVAIYTSVDERI